jgi:aerobic carbon-monoxide dehydrogenase small subunit
MLEESEVTSSRMISFTLNGAAVTAPVQPHENMVDLLTGYFGLKGARESCGQGLCGCCTIYVNDQPVSGCLFLADMADGTDVVTIEGLGENGRLDPVQEAFIEAGAFQCGFCTPGFVMMVKKLLEQNPDPSDDEIKHYLAGNLCRCSAYPEIIEATRLAARLTQRAGV